MSKPLEHYQATAEQFARSVEKRLGFTPGRLTVTPTWVADGRVTAHVVGDPPLTASEMRMVTTVLAANPVGRA